MKGHTKIELTNTKTGEVQILEDDNIVTNLLQDLYKMHCMNIRDSFGHTFDRTLVYYDSENSNRAHTPFTEFGGLVMFEERLEADPDNYYPKESVTMTAHASNDTYAGTDLTRGSFNSNLSSYNTNDGTVTLVWDFNMEQGNGTIGTVCLCNHVDGKIGYGSEYSTESTNNARAPFYHHAGVRTYCPTDYYVQVYDYVSIPADATEKNLGSVPLLLPVYLDYENNQIVFMYAGLFKDGYRFVIADADCSAVNPISVKSYYTSDYKSYGVGRDQLPVKSKYTAPVNIVTKDLGSVSSYNGWNYYHIHNSTYIKTVAGLDYQGNFWYADDAVVNRGVGQEASSGYQYSKLDYCWCWKSGTKKIFHKLNLATMETTDYELTNATGVDIYRNGGYYSGRDFLSDLCVVNGYMFIRAEDKLFAINLENNADVKQVKWFSQDGNPVSLLRSSSEPNQYTFANNPQYGSSSNNLYNYGWAVNVLGNFIIFNTMGGYAPATANWTGYRMCILDATTFTAQYLSASAKAGFYIPDSTNIHNFDTTNYTVTPVNKNLVMGASSGGNGNWSATNKYFSCTSSILHGYNPMGLITINTLSEPVTKTADMTMRITYTLTA